MSVLRPLRSARGIDEYEPICPLPPVLLIPDYIHNLAIDFVLPFSLGRIVDNDEASSFDPDGIAKARWKLYKQLLVGRRFDMVQVFARCDYDACY